MAQTNPKITIQTKTGNKPDDLQEQKYTQDEAEQYIFLDTLVMSITGYPIHLIPEDKREEILTDCVKLYTDHIIEYVKVKFGAKSSIRLKASLNFSDGAIFSKFKGLDVEFDEAYSDFITSLQPA